MARYTVLGGPNGDQGVNHGDVRAEPGEEIDIPDAVDVAWMVDAGILQLVPSKRASAPKTEV